jgi:flagellar assembly factor FliW
MTASVAFPIDIETGAVLYLDAGLPGFPAVHRFRLSPWGAAEGPFLLLQCLDVDDLAFVVVRPELFFPDYQPAINFEAAGRLGLNDPGDATVYVIVTLGRTPPEATVNLLGPLIVNRNNGRAAQVVLDGNRYDVRTPLLG